MTDDDGQLDIDISRGDGDVLVRLVGELDPHTAPRLASVLDELQHDGDLACVVLDLARLGFIDSSGLRVIISADQGLRQRDGRLVLRAPSEATRRLLEITDLLDRFTIE